MNSAASEQTRPGPAPSGESWVVGYGNSRRADDGLGPWVAAQLAQSLQGQAGPRVLIAESLEPQLLDQLARADLIILVDATVQALEEGRCWERVMPDLRQAPLLTHHCSPAFLLGLLEMVHGRRPPAWLLTVQGHDFAWRTGLSPWALPGARAAVEDLLNLFGGREDHGHRS